MEVQQPMAFAWNAAQVGRTREVLIDTPLAGEQNVWVGRSYADAPDIDGLVYVTGPDLDVGDLVPCEVVTYKDYDLVATPVAPR